MALLEFQNVSYEKDNKTLLKNMSLSVDDGDFISVVGHSGSGKSTFFRLCAHLISPTSGNIFFNAKSYFKYPPTELRKDISYCFQAPYLFGDTIMDNMKFPYSIRNVKIDMNRVKKLFSDFNLSTNYFNKDIKNLSGGEKQRIALIRTILFRPKILLLDEITSALDVDNTKIVENVVQSLHNAGVTIMWITHSPEQSKRYANKILTIENGCIKSLEVLK